MDTLNKIHIGSDAAKQLEYDRQAEEGAIKAYNEAMPGRGT